MAEFDDAKHPTSVSDTMQKSDVRMDPIDIKAMSDSELNEAAHKLGISAELDKLFAYWDHVLDAASTPTEAPEVGQAGVFSATHTHAVFVIRAGGAWPRRSNSLADAGAFEVIVRASTERLHRCYGDEAYEHFSLDVDVGGVERDSVFDPPSCIDLTRTVIADKERRQREDPYIVLDE